MSRVSEFLRGFGSAIDLFGTSFQLSIKADEIRDQKPGDGFRKDAEALRSDWEAVGRDMRWAMAQVSGGVPDDNPR